MHKIKLLFFIVFSVVLSPLEAQSLKVMTYNIRYATENDGINAWSKRKGKVFDLIRKYDPDVIGIQEALVSQIKDIIIALPEYAYVGVGRDDGKEGGEYSAILYKKKRFLIEDQNTFWLSETPQEPGSKDWDAAITRVATWAKMTDKKSRRSFFVLNTHFDHIGKVAREKSAGIIRSSTAQLAGNMPVIITGDFNFQRNESPYPVLMAPGEPKLIDPAPANAPGTYCTFGVNTQPCVGIDYILHTPEWTASNYTVVTDNDGSNYPSDHLPVLVKLKR